MAAVRVEDFRLPVTATDLCNLACSKYIFLCYYYLLLFRILICISVTIGHLILNSYLARTDRLALPELLKC